MAWTLPGFSLQRNFRIPPLAEASASSGADGTSLWEVSSATTSTFPSGQSPSPIAQHFGSVVLDRSLARCELEFRPLGHVFRYHRDVREIYPSSFHRVPRVLLHVYSLLLIVGGLEHLLLRRFQPPRTVFFHTLVGERANCIVSSPLAQYSTIFDLWIAAIVLSMLLRHGAQWLRLVPWW